MGISAIRDTPLIPVLRVYEYPGDAEQPAYSGPSGYGFSGDPGNPRIRHLDTRAALPLSRPLCDRGIHELGLITPRSETDEDGLVRPVGRPVRPRKSPGTSGSNTGRGRASDETASSVQSSPQRSSTTMSLPLLPWCGVRADRRSPMRIESGVVEPFDFRCRRRPTTNFTRPRARSSNPIPSSGESANHQHDRLMAEVAARISHRRVLGAIP